LPCAPTALTQMYGNARLMDPREITRTKINIACPQHPLFDGVSRPGPACERQCQLKSFA
jgi:hypothetical protein